MTNGQQPAQDDNLARWSEQIIVTSVVAHMMADNPQRAERQLTRLPKSTLKELFVVATRLTRMIDWQLTQNDTSTTPKDVTK